MTDQNTVPCPNCGHLNRVGARFCGQCSKPLASAMPAPQPSPPVSPAPVAPAPQGYSGPAPQVSSVGFVPPSLPQEQMGTRFCPKCGQAVTPGTNFCRHCGCDLSETALPASAPSPQPVVHQASPVGMSAPMQMPPPLPQPVTPSPHRTRQISIPGWGWLLIGLLLGVLLSLSVIMFTTVDPKIWLEPATPTVQVTPAPEETVAAEELPTSTPEPVATPAP